MPKRKPKPAAILSITHSYERDLTADRPIRIEAGTVINGTVTAPTVHVAGLVRGNVEADAVEILPGGCVDGDTRTQSITIEVGGQV